MGVEGIPRPARHDSVITPVPGLPVTASSAHGFPVTAPNIDEFLFLPVFARLWQQHELWDGTYTLDDLLDAVELIQITRNPAS